MRRQHKVAQVCPVCINTPRAGETARTVCYEGLGSLPLHAWISPGSLHVCQSLAVQLAMLLQPRETLNHSRARMCSPLSQLNRHMCRCLTKARNTTCALGKATLSPSTRLPQGHQRPPDADSMRKHTAHRGAEYQQLHPCVQHISSDPSRALRNGADYSAPMGTPAACHVHRPAPGTRF